MENIVLLLLSILPSIVLGFIIYKQDKIEKEPFYLLARLIIGGILAVFLTLVISIFIPTGLQEFLNINLITLFIYIFATVGLIEELSKWIFLRVFTWNSKEFKHIYDAVVYAVFISLGFATLENIIYIFSSVYTKNGTFLMGVQTGLLRSVLSVPGHAFFGAFMGFYYGLAKQAFLLGKIDLYSKNIRKSILIPALLHGIFDTLLFSEKLFFFLIYLVFVVILYIMAILKIRQFAKINKNMDIIMDKETFSNPLFNTNLLSDTNNICHNCDFPNDEGSNYCVRCGVKLK